MSETVAESKDPSTLVERLAANPDGVLERIAEEHRVALLDVVRALPAEHRTVVPGDQFAEIMSALTGWGDVLVIVHTPDIVLECKGAIPAGTFGRGYYNLHGDSPVGGHIRSDRCQQIAFVSRPFMGRPSCSIQFFNGNGEAIFKVFVRRDENRELVAGQVAKFVALQERYARAA